MKTLQKIITGAALTGALMFGYNANAQESKIVPTKIATETSIVANKDVAGVPFQRVEAGNDAWTFKYDLNMKLKPTDNPLNVGLFSLNKLYDKNNLNIGAEAFQVGKLDGKDTWFVDSWATKKFKDMSLMIDLGLGFPDTKYTQTYAIGAFKHPKTSISGAVYSVNSDETRYYGYAAYHDHNLYGAIGNKVNTSFASTGIYGLKNFGNLTFATHNRDNGNIWSKSQFAFGNVNSKFYSVGTFDLASDIFSMPMFQPIHLTPLSTKGDYTIKLEYKRNKPNSTHETELMLGTDKTPFVQVGLGVNTEYKNNSSISNVAIELYKDVKLGKFTGAVEARYNARTSSATGYVKMSYEF